MKPINQPMENIAGIGNTGKDTTMPGFVYSIDFNEGKALGCLFSTDNRLIYNLMFLYVSPSEEKEKNNVSTGDLSILEELVENDKLSLYCPIKHDGKEVGSFNRYGKSSSTSTTNVLINYIQNTINLNYNADTLQKKGIKNHNTHKARVDDLYKTTPVHKKENSKQASLEELAKFFEGSYKPVKQDYKTAQKENKKPPYINPAKRVTQEMPGYNKVATKKGANYKPIQARASNPAQNYQVLQNKTKQTQAKKAPLNYNKNNLENRLTSSYQTKGSAYSALPNAGKTNNAYALPEAGNKNTITLNKPKKEKAYDSIDKFLNNQKQYRGAKQKETAVTPEYKGAGTYKNDKAAKKPYTNIPAAKKTPVIEKKPINYKQENGLEKKLAPGYGVKKPSYQALPKAGTKNAYALPEPNNTYTIPFNNNQHKEKTPVNSIDDLTKGNPLYKAKEKKASVRPEYKGAGTYKNDRAAKKPYNQKKPIEYQKQSPYKTGNLENKLKTGYKSSKPQNTPKGLLQDKKNRIQYGPKTLAKDNYKNKKEQKPNQYKAMTSGGMKPGTSYLRNLANNPKFSPLPDYTKNPIYSPASDNGYMKPKAPYNALPSANGMKALPPGSGYQKALPASPAGNILNMGKGSYGSAPAYAGKAGK
ncbi:MAG: hypothetical protein ACOCQG_05150 [Candidatus Nanoarchaeia archaeon]